MARITASVYSSHVPAIGAAIDLGKTAEPYWVPLFKGYEPSKQWMREHRPDVIFLVYNDHATAFSLEMIPTFAIGCAEEFAPIVDASIGIEVLDDVGPVGDARQIFQCTVGIEIERLCILG